MIVDANDRQRDRPVDGAEAAEAPQGGPPGRRADDRHLGGALVLLVSPNRGDRPLRRILLPCPDPPQRLGSARIWLA